MVLVTQKKRPNSVHHKRRAGQHHKHDPHYAKTYWPYLPVAAVVGLGMLVNSFWPTLQNVLGYATNMSVSGLLSETNAQRGTESLGALAVNAQLNQAAQAKANDMATRNYWSHDTPEGSPPWTFFNQAGYSYQAAGENLAYGFDNSNAAIVAWMNSPGHRANLMNGTFQEVGFGIANVANYQNTGEQTIVVAMYGKPLAAAAPAPVAAVPKAKPAAKPAPAPAPTPTPETPPPSEPTTVAASQKDDTLTAAEPKERAPQAASVSRVQLLTNGAAPWSLFVISAVAAAAIALFILRHGLFWHRMLVKGERFIIKHPVLDVALVAVAMVGFVLTRAAGSIY